MTTEVQRRSKARRDTGTRDRLVSAARTCLRVHGRDRASSRIIADAAHANLAAITYYFGSKDDLLAAALADELAEWTAPALDALAAPTDPVTRLLDAVAILDAAFEQARDRVPALLEVFVHAARDEHADGPVAGTWATLRTRLAGVIAELRDSGTAPSWVDPVAMASLILTVVAGTVVATAVDPAGTDHRAIAAQFAALLLAARGELR
jgi:AcrR family transcriptional regulator